jgi:hypothetical protein
MPAKPKKSEPADEPVPAVDATDEVTAEGDDEAPLNRAERRAKGKSAAKPPVVGKIQPGRTNLNHGPRSYANRRSG